VKLIEKILVLLMLFAMALPALQKQFNLFPVKELEGDFYLAEKLQLSWSSWYNGEFQANFDEYLEDHIGFRNFFVRVNNQIDYSLYRIPHAEGVVVGKHDQLFEYDYIRAYMGGDFLGEKIIDKKMRMLRFLQLHLKETFDIDFVLVFEPGKASFYSEYIPDDFLNNKEENTNYDWFIKKAEKYNVKYINLKEYFMQLKGNTQYPLYPQYGTHWSIYGMSYAADSLIRYIEKTRDIDMPEAIIDTFQVEKHARRPDYDVGKTLNLLWRLKEKEPLAYPVYRFEEKPENTKPMVLVVGDSYYWNIFNTGIPKNLFKNEAFWYFFSQVYPDSYYSPKSVDDLNIKEEIEKQDVIFLMVTERFLYKFSWSFLEKTYAIYAPISEYDRVFSYKNAILGYDVWFNNVIDKARNRNITLGEMLDLEARYQFQQVEPEKFYIFDGLNYYINQIVQTPDWIEKIKAKAEQNNLDLDELLIVEADYAFKNYKPEAYDKFAKIQQYKNRILDDSTLYRRTEQLAAKYYKTFEEMLQIEAERMAKE
jgi:hypothetical protein